MSIFQFIRDLYQETGTVYKFRLHRILSLLLLVSGGGLAYANFLIDPSTLNSGPDDYTLVGVWLIVVPIIVLALANYHFIMKPALVKRRLRLE